MDVDRIRVFVTPPSGHQAIPERASADLGFKIELCVYPTEQLVELAIGEP